MEQRWVAECGSTNTELLTHLRQGGGPLLLVAERQTAGRGRLGRAWQSRPGDSLTFSMGLSLGAGLDLSGLSLAVGAALADALEPGGSRIGLKWPNDLWLDGRAKLGGILIETVGLEGGSRGVVIGVGLNLAPLPPEADRSDFASGHAALQTLLPGIDARGALAACEPALRALLAEFEAGAGFAPWRAAFARRDLACGQPVRVGERAGIARGVSTCGELLLDVAGERQRLSGGELSLRFDNKEVKPCAP